MDQASTYINERFISENETAYSPTWMLVAQWDRVHPHPHGADDQEGIEEEYLNRVIFIILITFSYNSYLFHFYLTCMFFSDHLSPFICLANSIHISQTNTYQGVIITDTVRTYYVFTYVCGEIEWSGLGTETAIVGFNSNGDFFDNHPANGLSDIGELIACNTGPEGVNRTYQENGGEVNELSFNLDLAISKAACIDVANRDDEAFENIDDVISLGDLPECEQLRARLELGAAFQEFPQQAGNCYRSSNVVNAVGNNGEILEFVSVCCYDNNG